MLYDLFSGKQGISPSVFFRNDMACRRRRAGVAVSLSQEQDGGSQGRACIYVHQGQALFRVVKADKACQPEIIIENQS